MSNWKDNPWIFVLTTLFRLFVVIGTYIVLFIIMWYGFIVDCFGCMFSKDKWKDFTTYGPWMYREMK